MSEQDSSSTDLGNLFDAHDKIKRWTAERENASARLEMAYIRERYFELRSQHEPLASMCGPNTVARQKILDAIFYVVIGRWPKP